MKLAETERKKFQSRIPFLLDPGQKIQKNAEKFKKLKKYHYGIASIQYGIRQAEKEKKKKLVPNSVASRLGQENSKTIAKKFEKLKNIILALFPFKPG